MTYICISIGLYAKSVDYQFSGSFRTISELPSQFSPDMSDLGPEHIQLAEHIWLAGHVRLLAQTCPSIGFEQYIRGSYPFES
jgi:hypothetical protein